MSVCRVNGVNAPAAHRVSAAFPALAQLALSELRADVAGVFESDWAISERCRMRRLALALQDACEREGFSDLVRIIRSIAALAAVPRSEAVALYPELRRKFKALIHLAEGHLSGRGVSVA